MRVIVGGVRRPEPIDDVGTGVYPIRALSECSGFGIQIYVAVFQGAGAASWRAAGLERLYR